MATEETPAVDMAMSAEDFAELRARVAAISQQDVQLGRVLDLLVLHVGHAHGLDPVVEDTKAKAAARQAARDAEDASLKDAAETLAKARLVEDAVTHTPEQLAAIQAQRAAQDAQIKADADALAKTRAEEDGAAELQATNASLAQRGLPSPAVAVLDAPPAEPAPEAFSAPVEGQSA